MVKINATCNICHKFDIIFTCKSCQYEFCLDCIMKIHPKYVKNIILRENKLDKKNTLLIGGNDNQYNRIVDINTNVSEGEAVAIEEMVEEGREVAIVEEVVEVGVVEGEELGDNEAIVDEIQEIDNYDNTCTDICSYSTDYCPFRCIRSLTSNNCFDCGGKYVNMYRCLCCQMVYCSKCQKNNLFLKKYIKPTNISNANLFCSLSCYEIFIEQPNNRWCICEDCGEEYFDIGYKRCCSSCLLKHQYHKDVIYIRNRDLLNCRIKIYLLKNNVCENYLEQKLKNEVINKTKTYSSVLEHKITLKQWFNSSNIGNNLCYNIWDEVIEDYLIKN